ncbi:MAG TPA: hemolysin family protein [Thermoanaerobaculia bacterium]|nr:hemolysin family protein [Thermoanaerobaculia bacterium]
MLSSTLCGILFLIFDATRHFIHQLSPVGLRRLTTDLDDTESSRWLSYDPDNFQLVSGALLQLALIGAVASTFMSLLNHLGRPRAILIATLVWAAIILVWKFILALIPDQAALIALRGAIPISYFFFYLFWPILYPLRRLAARLDREAEEAAVDEEPTEEAVQAYIDVGEEEGILEGPEGRLVHQIVDFGDRMAHELMTPRIDVLGFDTSRPMHELARLFSESKYSRIPIYHNSIDTITGIVHIKEMYDAILKGEDLPVAELARPPFFVSETKKVSELLREFQSEHVQVAVVVDEFGGTAGLISIEDVIEGIVGDIADEHEEEETTIVDLGDGNYLVSGLVRVEQLEETLHAQLAAEDYETVAGLIFTMLGRVPSAGTVVTKNGYRFEVDRADRRRIYRVKVSRDPDWRPEGEEEEYA